MQEFISTIHGSKPPDLKSKSEIAERRLDHWRWANRESESEQIHLDMSGADRRAGVQVRVKFGNSRTGPHSSFKQAGFGPNRGTGKRSSTQMCDLCVGPSTWPLGLGSENPGRS